MTPEVQDGVTKILEMISEQSMAGNLHGIAVILVDASGRGKRYAAYEDEHRLTVVAEATKLAFVVTNEALSVAEPDPPPVPEVKDAGIAGSANGSAP